MCTIHSYVYSCAVSMCCFHSPHNGRHHSVPDSHRNGGEASYTSRNYTIVGNYKVAFPQWRVMRCPYPGLYLPLSFTLSPLPHSLTPSLPSLSLFSSFSLLFLPHFFSPLSSSLPFHFFLSHGLTHMYSSLFSFSHPHSHSPDTGPAIFRSGEEVYVVGRSQKRGYLVVEHGNRQIHVPHYCTELRVRTVDRTFIYGGHPLGSLWLTVLGIWLLCRG